MGEKTGIEWCDHTFNPWWGCLKVSSACDNCYAETLSRRFGEHWGAHAEYRTFGDKHWNEPLRWNRTAEKAGVRRRVFCASMGDVFDNRAPDGARDRLWALIRATPALDWLLLTKRPQNIARMLPPDWGGSYPNVWLGTTCENQEEAERRIPHLLAVLAVVRFLSCEPLLGPLDLDHYLRAASHRYAGPVSRGAIQWVIAGGESGPGARPSHPMWFRRLRDQCVAADVPYFFKQWGDWVSVSEAAGPGAHHRFPDGATVRRTGKKLAGAALDGQAWREFPRGLLSVAKAAALRDRYVGGRG